MAGNVRVTWGLGKGLVCQAMELGNGFVGHGEPGKAVEQGSPGPESTHTRRACSMEAEFSAENFLVGALPWGVLQAHYRPSAPISSVITGKALPILEFPHLQNRRTDQKAYLEVLPSL